MFFTQKWSQVQTKCLYTMIKQREECVENYKILEKSVTVHLY